MPDILAKVYLKCTFTARGHARHQTYLLAVFTSASGSRTTWT